MIVIDDKLVSDELIEERFVCNLEACKGICCVEGDFGAPLEAEEVLFLEQNFDKIRPFLSEKGIKAIEEQGTSVIAEDNNLPATTLYEGGPCAYVVKLENGQWACGVEMAFLAGAIPFRKPISCHLYPIRAKKLQNHTLVNYDRWDICSEACTLGDKLKVPVYQFLKAPIERAWGTDFYIALDGLYKEKLKKKK